ncbi:VWA domain-containing protein [Roseiflexus sp.]|uniref:VWA domain-containing protein n=1 Tax=Roseiflexus sp. TaxID=2562120 RepID=UPI0021DE8584|nr:VWA domain-containing protein [Roseiflexus sp.]GIW00329.1 MAG: VWA domain-containing protein [Roseiflexus sp.]
MIRLSFITPLALTLLALIPALWALTLLTPRRLAPWRFWSSLVLRSIILLALTLALAGTQIVLPVRELTTVFLVDVSDSMTPAQRERALQYVNDALAAMPPGDQAAVVVFGDNALVERAPGPIGPLSRLTSVPITTRTNLQEAVQLGLALFPAETQKRLVLISDGGENAGRVADAAQLAAIRKVPIDVVYMPGERGPDVIVAGLSAPAVVREGQDLTLQANITSNYATSGRLQTFVDGQLIGEQELSIPEGASTIDIRVPSGETGFRRIEVRLDADGDTEPQNNRGAAFTEVLGPPRLLLIASDEARAVNLRDALRAAEVRVDVLPPDQAPATLDQLGAYAGVIIVDTPARDMPRTLMEALPVYVRELGRGLAMVGGIDSFGAGGYRRTPLEPVLPVLLDPLDTKQQPDLALVMVIDRSGSMSELVGGSRRNRLDLAKEAVYQASLGLTPIDQVGLVVFDDAANWVLPLQRLPSVVEIERALGSFGIGGGTNIRPGIEQAAQALASADAKVKHVILLTDGIAESNYSDLIAQMRAAGVTISTVAIGEDANPNLVDVANAGGGRSYRVTRIEDVPRIFLQETIIAAGRDIVEERIEPQAGLPSPIIRSLGGLPPLYGYNGAEVREAARTFLFTPDGKPLLAQWQYGLGRVVAWTSDTQGRWARDWIAWDQFPRFVGGMTDLLLPPRESGTLELRATAAGPRALLELTAQDEQGRPLNNLVIAGRAVDPQNQGTAVQFQQIGPGQYRAVVDTSSPGVYLAQVAVSDAEGRQIGVAVTGIVVSYSLEYSAQRENLPLLSDVAGISSGRINPPPDVVFASPNQNVGSVREIGLPLLWLALFLWPLDIAARRVMVRMDDVAPWLERLRRRRPSSVAAPEAASTMTRLGAAKRRAMIARTLPNRGAAGSEQSVTPPVMTQSRQTPPPAPESRPSAPASGASETRARSSEKRPVSPEATEEQFARLLAAKQRARRKSEER